MVSERSKDGNERRERRFALALYALKQADDRATLARLRRGVGKPLGVTMDVYPFLGEHLESARFDNSSSNPWVARYDETLHLIAGLFALHPIYPRGAERKAGTTGTTGTSSESTEPGEPDPLQPREAKTSDNASGKSFLWSLRQLPNAEELPGLERRVVAILNADYPQLEVFLRHAVGLLRNADAPIPVDWERLVRDLTFWDLEDRSVQKQWASAWWRHYSLSTVVGDSPLSSSDESESEGYSFSSPAR